MQVYILNRGLVNHADEDVAMEIEEHYVNGMDGFISLLNKREEEKSWQQES